MRISVKRRTKQLNDLSLIFLVLSFGAACYTVRVFDTHLVWIGVGTLVVALGGLSYSMIREQLIIEVDERGIYDRDLGVGKIQWADVDDIALKTTNESQFLCFSLKNPDHYLRRLRGPKRATAIYHRNLGLNRFNVDITDVDIDPIDLKRLVDFRVNQSSMRR